MGAVSLLRLFVVFAVVVCAAEGLIWAQDQKGSPLSGQSNPPDSRDLESRFDEARLLDDSAGKVEQAVIHPFRSANVGAEVSGVVKDVHFEEGDTVGNEQVVVELYKDRDAAVARKTEEKLRGLELELQRAEVDVKIKEELVTLGGGTRQELEKSQAEVEITTQKIKEAKEELKISRLNLAACEVRAPFSGYMAVRYKQPYETVERLEKVFAILDSSKVYAVANVPENLLPKFKKGAEAVFVHSSGKRLKGIVDRVGTLIDPKSMTKRVHVLIDNSAAEMEVGMTGTVEPGD
jgi:RND family efflux transporter MFP subunit